MSGPFAAPSLGWLVRHELRLAWRARARKAVLVWLGYALLALYVAGGCFVGWMLRDTPIPVTAAGLVGVFAGVVVIGSFMIPQAILGSQRTLYEAGDLDLLFTAPISPRTVLMAKLLGIAGTIALTYAALMLPMVVPIAVLGHPELLGLVAVLLALALAAAAIGLAITLGLARASGPRAARTVGQIAAALLGGAFFLITQLNNNGDRRHPAMERVFDWLRGNGIGSRGLSAWPGRAAFGDPLPMLTLLAIGVALFVLVGWSLQRQFLTGYQAGGMRLARASRSGRPSARLFRAGLFATIFAKEWRLLARDPAIAFQLILRLVYLAPIVLLALRQGHAVPWPPTVALASVLIAGQLVGSLAWLAISAEDAPDLIAVSPVPKAQVDLVKLAAAMAVAAPLAVVPSLAIATRTVLGALATLAFTAVGGGLAGLIELKLGKPAPRSTFQRRRGGSMVAGILSLLVTLIFGGGAAVVVYLLG